MGEAQILGKEIAKLEERKKEALENERAMQAAQDRLQADRLKAGKEFEAETEKILSEFRKKEDQVSEVVCGQCKIWHNQKTVNFDCQGAVMPFNYVSDAYLVFLRKQKNGSYTCPVCGMTYKGL
jgi:rubrerythrin